MKNIPMAAVGILLFLSAGQAAATPEVSLDYIGGNGTIKSNSEEKVSGTTTKVDEENVTELSGFLLDLRYPIRSFTLGLEYGNGETKDVDGNNRGFSLTEIKAGYRLFEGERLRFEPYLSRLDLTADGTEADGAMLGADIAWRFNDRVVLEGSAGYSLSTSMRHSDTYDDPTLWNYGVRLSYQYSDRLSFGLGYRSYLYEGTFSSYTDANNYRNAGLKGDSTFYTIGLAYRFGAAAAQAPAAETANEPVPEAVKEPVPEVVTEPEAVKEIVREAVKHGTFLEPVFFEVDSAEIGDDRKPALDRNIEVLKADVSLYILVGGHADESGTNEYNMDLSRRRAGAVRDYLVARGIRIDRITVFAYGKEYPYAKGKSEQWESDRWVDIVATKEPPTLTEGIRK